MLPHPNVPRQFAAKGGGKIDLGSHMFDVLLLVLSRRFILKIFCCCSDCLLAMNELMNE